MYIPWNISTFSSVQVVIHRESLCVRVQLEKKTDPTGGRNVTLSVLELNMG